MSDQLTRKKLIAAAIELSEETERIDKITVRQIADRAGVGIGLINYHFQSKDNLLRVAIGEVMVDLAHGMFDDITFASMPPKGKLKALLKRLFEFGSSHEKLARFTLQQGFMGGDLNAAMFIMPLVKELHAGTTDETRLRLIASQIIIPLQFFSLHPKEARMYHGYDLNSADERNRLIDTLVDLVIPDPLV